MKAPSFPNNVRGLAARVQCMRRFFVLGLIPFFLSAQAVEPGIRLVSPEDGAVFATGDSILFKAEARGPQAADFQKIEFVSRAVIGEAATTPFTFEWKDVQPG